VAIAKPWGSPVEPVAQASPTPRTPSPSPSTTGEAPTPTTAPAAGNAFDVFVIAEPPPETATWTGLRWRRLDPHDPLAHVESVVPWGGGYVALGRVAPDAGSPSAPAPRYLWTSADGARWDVLPPGTAETFWPGLAVVAVAAGKDDVVAITALPATGGCATASACPPGFMSWTSADGRTWDGGQGSVIGDLSKGSLTRLMAAGPAGLLVVSGGGAARVATSPDGITWTARSTGAIPSDFDVSALVGTPTGYVAGGVLTTGAHAGDAATIRSPDGRRWTQPARLVTSPGSTATPGVEAFVAGSDGLVALGPQGSTPATGAWRSSDGLTWTWLDATPYEGLLAGDGRRMVAVDRSSAGAWTSTDGAAWHPLQMLGDVPGAPATWATLFPGGVVVSDGTDAWYGEAIVE